MRRKAPLIAGGGPAGCAAAITLAHNGVSPLLIERQVQTGDALCGGFLSWRTLGSLERLGFAPPQGHRVERLRLFAGETVAEADLPQRAIGLSRYALDSGLMAMAESAGVQVERGTALRSWSDGALATDNDAAILAPTLFLATGKHDLRGLPRPRQSAQTLGLRVHLAASPSLARLCAGTIELHLFEGGYCGLVLQEDGRGNLCVAVRKRRLAEAGGDPQKLLSQWAAESAPFAERLAFPNDVSDAIGAVPYGWIAQSTIPGVFRLGDQAAVIPSLAGEGNGIALASGIMAANAWLEGRGANDFQRRFAASARRPVTIAKLLWRIGEHPAGARLLVEGTRLLPALAATLAGQTRIRY